MSSEREHGIGGACIDLLVLAIVAPLLLMFAALRAPRSILRL